MNKINNLVFGEHIAVEGERWDTIYYKHYGHLVQNGYRRGYNAFLLANIELLDIDVFKGGERVLLPIFEEVEEIGEDIPAPWDF